MEAVGSAIAVIQLAGLVAKLCGRYISTVKGAPKDAERLQQKIVALRDVLTSLIDLLGNGQQGSVPLSARAQVTATDCLDSLESLRDKLEPRTKDKALSKLGWRTVRWPLSKSDVNEEIVRLEGFLTIFTTALQLAQLKLTSQIDVKIDHARMNELLYRLSTVAEAAANSYENKRHQHCLEGTRIELLDQIDNWAADDRSRQIFWLRGRAGTGKSTIALSVTELLAKPDITSASFFFKRGDGNLARGQKVLTTIVSQFAHSSLPFKMEVCRQLEEHPDAGTASLAEQFKQLLLTPLQNLKVRSGTTGLRRFVLVLDALDECDDMDDVRLLVRLFGDQVVSSLDLRVFVTSRPETPIRLGFESMDSILYHEISLDHVSYPTIDRDIRLFVQHELEQIRLKKSLPTTWPPESSVSIMADLAEGLFIYAATACKYIDSPQQISASARLEQVCSGRMAKNKTTSVLDEMYLLVLNNSVPDDLSAEELLEVVSNQRRIVGSTVLLLSSLPALALGNLLFPGSTRPDKIILDAFDSLHSMFDVPKDDARPIRMHHLSVRDFLLDPDRCADGRFRVFEDRVNRDLAAMCLSLMQEKLRENMCNLTRYATLTTEVSESSRKTCISTELEYACTYWAEHLTRSTQADDMISLVYDFLDNKIFNWLEVMSIIGEIPAARASIVKLQQCYDVENPRNEELRGLLHDVVNFMRSYDYILLEAPLHVYLAASLFVPTKSRLYNKLNHNQSDQSHIKTLGRRQLWGEQMLTLEHIYPTVSVAISPDDCYLASAHPPDSVVIWNVHSGRIQHNFRPEGRDPGNVLFTKDGSQLACVSGLSHIQAWDVMTGLPLWSTNLDTVPLRRPLLVAGDQGYTAFAISKTAVNIWDPSMGQVAGRRFDTEADEADCTAALARNGEKAALASKGRVTIWNVEKGTCEWQLMLEDNTCEQQLLFAMEATVLLTWPEKSFKFSLWNRAHFPSIPKNGICVWDISKQQLRDCVGNPFQSFHSVLAPNDDTLIFVEGDRILMWDIGTASYIREIRCNSFGIQIMNSTMDGTQLLITDDGWLSVVNTITGEKLSYPEVSHVNTDRAVIFPQGDRVAYETEDHSLTIWNVLPRKPSLESELSNNTIANATISQDQTCLAMAFKDGSMRVLRTEDGKQVIKLDGQHTSKLFTFGISRSTTLLASTYFDKTIRVWDIRTGICLYVYDNENIVANPVFMLQDSRVCAQTYHDNKLYFWDLGEFKHLTTNEWLCHHKSCYLTIDESPDETLFLIHCDHRLSLGDTKTGQYNFSLEYENTLVLGAQFSHNGQQVAICENDKVTIIDSHTGQELQCLTQDLWQVQTQSFGNYRLCFSHDDSLLITCAEPGLLLVWNIASGQCQQAFRIPARTLKVDVSPSGAWLTVSGVYHPTCVYEIRDEPDNIPQYHELFGEEDEAYWNTAETENSLHSQLNKTLSETDPHWQFNRYSCIGGWVYCLTKKVLWLPPEHRPLRASAKGNQLVLCSRAGFVTVVEEKEEEEEEKEDGSSQLIEDVS